MEDPTEESEGESEDDLNFKRLCTCASEDITVNPHILFTTF